MITKSKITRITFALMLLCASILLWNCEYEENLHIQQVQEKSLYKQRSISLKEIPDFIGILPKKIRSKYHTKTSRLNEAIFDEENILEVIDTLNNKNYSFRFVLPNSPVGEFYNLVIGKNSKGEVKKPFVLKYKSSPESLQNYIANNLDFQSFKGSISLHKYTDFFEEGYFSKTEVNCPPELDANGDPLPCLKVSGISGGGSGGVSTDSGSPDGTTTSGSTTFNQTGGTWGYNIGTIIIYSIVDTYNCPEGECTIIKILVSSEHNKASKASTDCPPCVQQVDGAIGVNATSISQIKSTLINSIRVLSTQQQDWINNDQNLSAVLALSNFLSTKLAFNSISDEDRFFVAKTIDILRGAATVSTLATATENRNFASTMGVLISLQNTNLFGSYSVLFKDLDTNNILSIADWNTISQKTLDIYNTISNTANVGTFTNFNQFSTTDQRLIATTTNFIPVFYQLKTLIGQYWPKNEEEWKLVGELFKQMVPQIIEGALPFGDILTVIRAVNNNNLNDLAWGIAGLIVDAAGGSILKAIAKGGKVAFAAFTSFKIVYKFIKIVTKAFETGLKSKLVGNVVHILDRTENTVAKITEESIEIVTKNGLKLVNPGGIKNLTKVSATQFGHINKDKLKNAHSFKPTEAGLKSDFDKLKNLDNNQLGLQSEELANQLFAQDKYKVYDAKIPGFNGNNGFDGVYIKKDANGNVIDIIINEVKQVNNGAIKLNSPTATLPRQMTDDWIRNVINRMRTLNTSQGVKNLADKIETALNNGKVTKVVTGIDKEKNNILVLAIK